MLIRIFFLYVELAPKVCPRLSVTPCTASNGRIGVRYISNDMEGGGSGLIEVSWHLQEGTSESLETPVRIPGVSAEIRTEHLTNSCLDIYHLLRGNAVVPLNYAPHHEDVWESIGMAPRILTLGNRWRRAATFTSRPTYPGEKNPGTQWIRGCVGPSANLAAMGKRESLVPVENRTQTPPSYS
jgi:hypothetical protein